MALYFTHSPTDLTPSNPSQRDRLAPSMCCLSETPRGSVFRSRDLSSLGGAGFAGKEGLGPIECSTFPRRVRADGDGSFR